MAKNDSRTKAFDTTAKSKKGHKSRGRIRQQIVISIFAVIALILVVFATLIIGKIIMLKKEGGSSQNTPPINTVSLSASDIKKGNLLLITDDTYSLPDDLSDMINVYDDQHDPKNKDFTHINGIPTYTLSFDRITLSSETLKAFNEMILDYCNSPEFVSKNDEVVSNLEIGWGGYSNATREEYQTDNDRPDFYDHGLGTSITLKSADYHTRFSETLFSDEHPWIYQNAHKYGFILRYPNKCQSHTGLNSTETIHLRYVGVEHATYIHDNGCCLDEYLEMLSEEHGYNNPLEIVADGKTFLVYYVEASGNPINVPVLAGKNYTVSGNNMNGFIVSVEK